MGGRPGEPNLIAGGVDAGVTVLLEYGEFGAGDGDPIGDAGPHIDRLYDSSGQKVDRLAAKGRRVIVPVDGELLRPDGDAHRRAFRRQRIFGRDLAVVVENDAAMGPMARADAAARKLAAPRNSAAKAVAGRSYTACGVPV